MTAWPETHVLSNEMTYDGAQLSPRWIYRQAKVAGSALVLFRGPCSVATDALVDWDDRSAGTTIKAKRMVHIVGEFFDWPLSSAIMLQHLIVSWISESVQARGNTVARRGNDLFVQGRKLNVSIVTAGAGSCLLHVGVNVDPTGAPVPAIGLSELSISEAEFIESFRARCASEFTNYTRALSKALPKSALS